MANKARSQTVLSLIIGVAILWVAAFYMSLFMLRPREAKMPAQNPEVPSNNSAFQKEIAENSIMATYTLDKPTLQPRDMAKVSRLSFRGCSQSFILKTIHFHPNVIFVVIESDRVDDSILNELTMFQTIRELRLRVKLLSCDLSQLRKLRMLESLSLSEMKTVRSSAIAQLSEIASLTSISIGYTIFEDTDFESFSKLPVLSQLIIYNTNFSNKHWSSLDCAQLTTLMLSKCNITDAGLPCLTNYPRLRVLSLEYCNISDDLIFHLSKCPLLQHCFIFATKVDHAKVDVFSLNGIPVVFHYGSPSVFEITL